MSTNETAPAITEFCVWADCNRRVYQHVEASSPEEAYRLAKENSDCWEFCFEHESDGYRLSNDVQNLETEENFTVGETKHCKTCGSEIVETVNDGAFRDGECNGCEYERYKSQPELLDAARGLYDLITELREDGCDLFDDHRPLLEHCYTVLQKHEQAS